MASKNSERNENVIGRGGPGGRKIPKKLSSII